MKIMHFCRLVFVKGNGITTAVVNQCLYENMEDSVKSKIIPTYTFESNEKNELYKDFTCNKLGIIFSKLIIFRSINQLLKAKPDMVYFHNIYDIKTIILSFFCKIFGISYIVVPHSSLMKNSQLKKKWLKKFYNNTLLKYMIHNASAISYLNLSEQSNSLEINPGVRKVIIPNGVRKIEVSPKELSCQGLRILYFGRYDINHKGIDILVKYIYDFREYLKFNNVTFSMYGSGDIDSVRSLVEINSLENLVSLNGPVFGKEKDIMFNTHDAFILTSRYEGLPIAVLEALSYGMPCILSENTNMKDSITKGAAFKCDSGNDFLGAVEMLLESNNYTEASKNASLFIDDNYSWQKIAKDRVKICRDILMSKGK
ncbi:glycosyltransferase [Vibrio cyclitrophicus]